MRLDIRTKILLLIFANISFLFRITGWLEWIIVIVFFTLLFLSDLRKTALFYLSFFLLIALLERWNFDLLTRSNIPILSPVFMIGRLALPSFMAGTLLLRTSSSYELIHGLRKWKVPESLLLTLAVMQRFLPAIREDSLRIHRALQVRGIFLRKLDFFCHPLKYGEYLLIPLLMSLIRTAQDLTIASLTKGLALDKRIEESFPSRFKWIDWSVCIWIFIMNLFIWIPLSW